MEPGRGFAVVLTGAATGEIWLRWLKEFQLGRKRILDTLLAATLHRHGARVSARTGGGGATTSKNQSEGAEVIGVLPARRVPEATKRRR